jgi:PAS domain S-box-containing protein
VERLLGYKPDELTGNMRFYDLLDPLADGEKSAVIDIFNNKQNLHDFVHHSLNKRGGAVILETSGAPILGENGELKGYRGVDIDITERERAQDALQASENRLRSVFSTANVGIAMETGRVLQEVNDEMCNILGYSREEMTGREARFLYINDEEYLRAGEMITRLEKRSEANREVWMARKDGHHVLIARGMVCLESWHPEKGITITVRDITRQKEAENALSEEITRRQQLFAQTPVGIVIIDPETAAILDFNTIAHEQLGYTREEFAGLTIHDLEAIETPDETHQRIADVYKTGKLEFDTLQRSKQDELRNIHIIAPSLNINNRQVYQCIWQDITERKRNEEAVRESERKIQESYDKLRRTLDGTIAAIAHMSEIRDPYTAGHQRRVAQLACAIAKEMGLPEEKIEGLRVACLVHDVGKVQVPSEILTKPGKLSPIEFQIIKTHATSGREILESVEFPGP